MTARRLKLIHGEGLPVYCSFCGVEPHEPHSEECRQAWRDLILSYKSKE